MVWIFSKESVKKLQVQFENTKDRLEGAFVEFEKLYQTIFEAYDQNKEMDHRYKLLADAAKDAIVLSIDAEIVEANQAAYWIVGYNPDKEKLIGMAISDIVFTKDQARLQQCLANESPTSCEVRLVHKLGYLIPVEVQSKGVVFEGKKGMITTFTDVSKQKDDEIKRRDTELELKRTKAHLGALLLKRGYITRGQLQDGLSFQDDLPKKLGDILVGLGYITQDKLTEALQIQEENRLGNILIRKNYITKAQLDEVLSQQEIEFLKLGLLQRK